MNAYSVSVLPKTSLRQVSADLGIASPKRISAISLPIVRIGTVCNLVLQLATLLNDAFYPRKNVEKAKDSRPRWVAHSAPPSDPLAGFKAVHHNFCV